MEDERLSYQLKLYRSIIFFVCMPVYVLNAFFPFFEGFDTALLHVYSSSRGQSR